MAAAPITLLVGLSIGWIFHRLVLLAFSRFVPSKSSPFSIGLAPVDFVPFARLLGCVFGFDQDGKSLDFSSERNVLLLLLQLRLLVGREPERQICVLPYRG